MRHPRNDDAQKDDCGEGKEQRWEPGAGEKDDEDGLAWNNHWLKRGQRWERGRSER